MGWRRAGIGDIYCTRDRIILLSLGSLTPVLGGEAASGHGQLLLFVEAEGS